MKDLGCATPCRATRSAATVEPLSLSAARLSCALVENVARLVRASDQNLGHLEAQVAHATQALLRQTVEVGAEAKADATGLRGPACQRPFPRTCGTRFLASDGHPKPVCEGTPISELL